GAGEAGTSPRGARPSTPGERGMARAPGRARRPDRAARSILLLHAGPTMPGWAAVQGLQRPPVGGTADTRAASACWTAQPPTHLPRHAARRSRGSVWLEAADHPGP